MTAPPWSPHPLPSLTSNCLNPPFETRGRSWRLKFAKKKKWGGHRKKGLCAQEPTGLCLVSPGEANPASQLDLQSNLGCLSHTDNPCRPSRPVHHCGATLFKPSCCFITPVSPEEAHISRVFFELKFLNRLPKPILPGPTDTESHQKTPGSK